MAFSLPMFNIPLRNGLKISILPMTFCYVKEQQCKRLNFENFKKLLFINCVYQSIFFK